MVSGIHLDDGRPVRHPLSLTERVSRRGNESEISLPFEGSLVSWEKRVRVSDKLEKLTRITEPDTIIFKEGRMGNNQKDERATHILYWERLAKAEPNEVCHRTGATYSLERKGYFLPILEQKYLILPGEQKIFCMRGDFCEEENLRDYFYLMVLLYLLDAKGGSPPARGSARKSSKAGRPSFVARMPSGWKS